MPEKAGFSIARFSTFEELESAFRRRTAFVVPRQYGGLRRFWEDFRELHHGDWIHGGAGADSAWITSNPRDCLAFGSTDQVLRGAMLTAGTPPEAVSNGILDLADRFDLTGQLRQPVRTLSGGETVRLAFAKIYGMAGRLSRLTVASPFSWLSPEGRRYFDRLVERLQSLTVPVELLALDGEDSLEPAPRTAAWKIGPDFRMSMNGVRFNLGTPLEGLFGGSETAEIEDVDLYLRSPCLLSGGNGEGKSLVAKVLSGAIGCEGRTTVGPPGAMGRGRLLFQDVANQTLMRQPSGFFPAGRRASRQDLMDGYSAIRNRMPAGIRELTPPDPAIPSNASERPPGLLTVKMLLTSSRLCIPPGAMILDEPDWGLSREAATGLVDGIVALAHARAVPVILISHKPWWKSLAGSEVRVEKRIPRETDNRSARLKLRLQMVGVS